MIYRCSNRYVTSCTYILGNNVSFDAVDIFRCAVSIVNTALLLVIRLVLVSEAGNSGSGFVRV